MLLIELPGLKTEESYSIKALRIKADTETGLRKELESLLKVKLVRFELKYYEDEYKFIVICDMPKVLIEECLRIEPSGMVEDLKKERIKNSKLKLPTAEEVLEHGYN